MNMDFLEDVQLIMEQEEVEEVHHILRERRPYNTNNRFFHKDIINRYDDVEFIKRYRLSRESVLHLLMFVEDQLQPPTLRNNPFSPLEQLLLALRFYATGSFYITIGDFGDLHKSTTGNIIARVTLAIANLRPLAIKLPETEEEKIAVKQKFYAKARFPRVLGVIDGTHIRMFQSPGGQQAETYRNRKGYFSLNVQVVSDCDYLIRDVIARWPGSSHDSNIFDNSRLRMKFENGEMGDGLLVGDSGYAVRRYMMTPLLNPVTEAQELYNESHIRTRNIIERTFGLWKRRFPVLSLGCRCKVPLMQDIIVGTAVLHNIAVYRNDPMPNDENEVEFEWGFIEQNGVHVEENDSVRREIIQYFATL